MHRSNSLLAKYIMWTSWHRATRVSETQLDQIGYSDGVGQLDHPRDLITVAPLTGIHMGTGLLLTQPARALLFDSFGFVIVGTVHGIQAQLTTQRLSRVQDHVIQLWYHGAQGINHAVLPAEDVQLYGDADDQWGITEPIDFISTAFGIVVDLQPHHAMPSSTRAIVSSVQMRLYVE